MAILNIRLERATGKLCDCGQELELRAFKPIGSHEVYNKHYYCPKCLWRQELTKGKEKEDK